MNYKDISLKIFIWWMEVCFVIWCAFLKAGRCCAVEYEMFNFFDLLETTVVPSESLYLFIYWITLYEKTWHGGSLALKKKNWRIINEHKHNFQFIESVWLHGHHLRVLSNCSVKICLSVLKVQIFGYQTCHVCTQLKHDSFPHVHA